MGVAGEGGAGPHADEVDLRVGGQRVEVVEVGDVREDRDGDADAAAGCGRAPREARGRPRRGGGGPARRRGRGRGGASRCGRRSVAMPSAKRAGSPRKRLTMKPFIRAASAGSRTARVPTRLAMTPPRSMSPMRTTGMSVARAKPMLAMSLARRLISEALPAPSMRTRSASARGRRSCRGRWAGEWASAPGSARASAVAWTRPWTTIWAPVSLWGLRRTGFMWTDGRDAGGAGLQRLGAADLAAGGGDGGVVGHVLRLERADAEAAVGEGAGEAGDDQRLADVGAGALEHQARVGMGFRGGQGLTAFCSMHTLCTGGVRPWGLDICQAAGFVGAGRLISSNWTGLGRRTRNGASFGCETASMKRGRSAATSAKGCWRVGDVDRLDFEIAS